MEFWKIRIMEPVGLAIGVVGLTGQLAKTAMNSCKVFDDMNDVGTTCKITRLRAEESW